MRIGVVEKGTTVTPAIPGYTPGAGKCYVCGNTVVWVETRVCRNDLGEQVGILKTFFCGEHKPE